MNKTGKSATMAIIAFILLSFGNALHAQEEDNEDQGLYLPKQKVFIGGLVAGANFSQISGDYYSGYYKTGVNAGGIVYIQVAKRVALSMEILYSQKGTKNHFAEPDPNNATVILVKHDIRVNYAEVPVMINYSDKHKSNIGVGFSYSQLVSSNETLQIDTASTLQNIDLNTKYPFKKVGLDFLAGANLHLLKKIGLYLNIRFQYSILPVRTNIPPPDYVWEQQSSNLWVVRLMYLFK